MRKFKTIDFGIHVVLPLIIGVLFYKLAATYNFLPGAAYLPDGLWAYSFFSAVLIVWNRSFTATWLSAVAATTVLFEAMQYFHLIDGTGDMLDALIYLFFGLIALSTNRFFRKIFKYQIN